MEEELRVISSDLTIRKATDYGMFKRMEGNRAVSRKRTEKIKSSILNVGYIPNPIIVNEKYEIIDGQGRFEALKQLGLPVFYSIVPNIGIDECIAMNMNQTNWSVRDYIESHAETGNVSYVYLLQLLNTYDSHFGLTVILNAITGKTDNAQEKVKSGDFQCSEREFLHAKEILSYLLGFEPIIRKIGGRKEFYYMAIRFCHDDPEVDNKRLLEKVTQLQSNLMSVSQAHQAFDQLEQVYNNRIRGEKVYIKTNYRKYQDGQYSWYSKKYGDKYKD